MEDLDLDGVIEVEAAERRGLGELLADIRLGQLIHESFPLFADSLGDLERKAFIGNILILEEARGSDHLNRGLPSRHLSERSDLDLKAALQNDLWIGGHQSERNVMLHTEDGLILR